MDALSYPTSFFNRYVDSEWASLMRLLLYSSSPITAKWAALFLILLLSMVFVSSLFPRICLLIRILQSCGSWLINDIFGFSIDDDVMISTLVRAWACPNSY